MNINELKKQIRSEFEKEFEEYVYDCEDNAREMLEAFLDKVIERVWNEARRENINNYYQGTYYFGENDWVTSPLFRDRETLMKWFKSLSSQDKGE